MHLAGRREDTLDTCGAPHMPGVSMAHSASAANLSERACCGSPAVEVVLRRNPEVYMQDETYGSDYPPWRPACQGAKSPINRLITLITY